MAHGFLSYQDGRGVSELEQQLTRIVGDQIEDYSKALQRSQKPNAESGRGCRRYK